MTALNTQNQMQLSGLARGFDMAGRAVRPSARRALSGGARASRRETEDSTLQILAIRRRSVSSRIRTLVPRGQRLEAGLDFEEDQLPLLTSFEHSGGSATGRGPRFRVRVRRDGPTREIRGAFVRRNTNAQNLTVSFVRARIGGVQVGRNPFNRAGGPSVVGLMLGRPGFADARGEFLIDEVENRFDADFVPQINVIGEGA